MAERRAIVRWLGAGIVELATPDYRQVCFVDAWFWSNRGWSAFGVELPAEYASPEGLVAYLQAKRPEAVLIALTHDHVDHIGDYFGAIKALSGAGLPIKTVLQADLARAGLVQRFKDEGLDNESIIVNGGVGTNIGGTATHGEMRVWCVPAVHSQFLPYPPVGYVIEIGGVRFYASGDTDVYGDLRLVGERYRPDCALVCVGDNAFTMGPDGAALAVELLGCRSAVPIHYAHNPQRSRGPDAGPEFESLVRENDRSAQVHVLKPGETVEITPS
jgi:L-ascorbate metabolism protein UlaG (beta-lactamase superfamily)